MRPIPWYRTAIVALVAAIFVSGCVIFEPAHSSRSYHGGYHHGYASRSSRGGYASHGGYARHSSHSSHARSGSRGKCPPGHVWSDGKCHSTGHGNEKK